MTIQLARYPDRGSFEGDWAKLTAIVYTADIDQPGIYIWRVGAHGEYIGRYKRRTRPHDEYRKNVLNLLKGLPYRPKNPDGFRKIHRALAHAILLGEECRVEIYENIDDTKTRTARETELIKKFKPALNKSDPFYNHCNLLVENNRINKRDVGRNSG